MELRAHPLTGFLVNNDGTYIKNPYTGKRLNPSTSPTGYLVVGRYTGEVGVHRLVYSAWVGIIPEGMQINHIDGVKTNNSINNLEVVTPRQNTIHAYATGLNKGRPGEDNSMATLTESHVLEMYELMKQGYNNEELADKYGVSSGYVSLVRHGHRWKYLYPGPMSKSFKFVYPKETIDRAIAMLDEGHTNLHISNTTGIERSNISRLRHGKIWSEYVEFYRSRAVTTIP